MKQYQVARIYGDGVDGTKVTYGDGREENVGKHDLVEVMQLLMNEYSQRGWQVLNVTSGHPLHAIITFEKQE